MKDVLLVFARYPETGKCKTRLIGALGPQGATELHESMTRFTLSWAAELADNNQIEVQVHFAGGDCLAMRERFGDHFEYRQQCTGNLGIKLRTAIQHCATNHGPDNDPKEDRSTGRARSVVVVGTDCPQLSSDVVTKAFSALDTHDVCIAPASDGGYTLVGLRVDSVPHEQTLDALFNNISWGSEYVLVETVRGLTKTSSSMCLLPTLSDVDMPEDLEIWEQAIAGQEKELPQLTVVIPTLGTEENLDQVVALTTKEPTVETIVVAAGDVAATAMTAARTRVGFINGPANRSLQMNLGATNARAKTLLFLHADTLLPAGFLSEIVKSLENPNTVGGAFRLRIDSDRNAARWVEWGIQVRTRLLKLPYGDQALFVRKSAFSEVGGFANQPIMEDFDFVRKLRKVGAIHICEASATTSARRWHRLGFLRTTVINQLMIVGYRLGISPDRLARFYRID